MSKYPFVAQYTVVYYDEDKKVMKHFHHSCVGFCDNFADAVFQIEDAEGTKELESINHLELFDEASNHHLISIDPNWTDDFIHRDFFAEAIDNADCE